MSFTPGQLALMIDLERCTGCKSCEAACKQTNALGPNSYRNRVMWFDQQEEASLEAPRLDFLTVTCQQCERPACLRACPVFPKAISKDPQTGVVAIDTDRCTGCGECALSCPYGAIGYNADRHHAVKCDLCAERRSKDLGPACAFVCPTRAISFGRRETLLEQAGGDDREILDTDHFLQNPATIYLKRSRDEQRDSPSAVHNSVPTLMSDNTVRFSLNDDDVEGTYRTDSRCTTSRTEERIVPGGCSICFNGCPVKYHLRGNDVVNIYGNEEDPDFQGRVCPKSQMLLQFYKNSHRITRPLKRTGPRGSNKFSEISWDQALDDIADKLIDIREQYGAEALAIQSGSRTGALNILGIIPMFSQLWGTPHFVTTEPYCSISKSVALELTQGFGILPSAYTADDIGSAQAYVYIGDNQAETRPVNFGMINDWRLRNRATMVVVDPRFTVTASKADDWLAIRSGTDLSLGLAIIHFLFENDLFDHAFCERWVEGWREWRDFVFARQFDLQWAQAATDLAPTQIEDLARVIANADGCMIFLSRGINQHSNGVQTNRVFMFIAAITGNWGRRGGGYFNVPSDLGLAVPTVPEDCAPAMRPSIGANPARWFDAMLKNDPYPLRALITSNNPLTHWPDQKRAREAVQSLDLVVHLELFRNATSRFADYLLPMASGIEKGGTTRFAEDRRVIWNDRLIDPPGEAKSDHWFWIELGKRFGFADVLKDDFKNPRRIWDELLVPCNPILSGVTTEYLSSLPNRSVRLPQFDAHKGEVDPVYITDNWKNGASPKAKFGTPSGKLEFWTEELEKKFNRVGLSALPEFYSEADQMVDLPRYVGGATSGLSYFHDKETLAQTGRILDQPAARSVKFDTELVTGRPPAPHFHSWTHYFWQAQEMWPQLYCQIHPEKASEIGVSDGDMVRVETESGHLEARAWVRQGIRRSCVFIPIGWDEMQPFHPAASVNQLTRVSLDPVSQQANMKTHLCRVTRA